MGCSFFSVQTVQKVSVLHLCSDDPTNRLTRACVLGMNDVLRAMAPVRHPLVIAGNNRFFSAGADLKEIASLDGPSAHEFATMGQDLMAAIERFPAPVYAGISGYCMGGRPGFSLSPSDRIAARRLWTPRCGFGTDHRLGRNPATASTGRQSARPRNIRHGREDQRATGLAHRTD